MRTNTILRLLFIGSVWTLVGVSAWQFLQLVSQPGVPASATDPFRAKTVVGPLVTAGMELSLLQMSQAFGPLCGQEDHAPAHDRRTAGLPGPGFSPLPLLFSFNTRDQLPTGKPVSGSRFSAWAASSRRQPRSCSPNPPPISTVKAFGSFRAVRSNSHSARRFPPAGKGPPGETVERKKLSSFSPGAGTL